MSQPEPAPAELLARIQRLEAQVAWLSERVRAGEATDPGLSPPAPRPLPRPVAPRPAPRPRKAVNPIVAVAGAGGLLFLAGMAFFLRWSIQQGWLGPGLRFSLGLAAGLALSALAARLCLRSALRLGTALLVAGLGSLLFVLRIGAFGTGFFPPAAGFAGSFLLVIGAGGLSARTRHGGPLAVALGAGLAAPLIFSTGAHEEVALGLYLALLMAGALAVPYFARIGGGWGIGRWIGLAGVWSLLAAACLELPQDAAGVGAALLALHLALGACWVWLPGAGGELPRSPGALWTILMPSFTALAWGLWTRKLHWPPEAFAAPVLGLSLLNFGLMGPLRRRLGTDRQDLTLLAFGLAFLALAVPVGLAWHWVGPIWSGFALALAWVGARGGGFLPVPEPLRSRFAPLALGMVLGAGLRWLIHGGEAWDFSRAPEALLPFLNARFAEGALLAGACGLLAQAGRGLGPIGILGAQGVGGLCLGIELAHLVRFTGGSVRSASIALTLAWAVLGALQWLAGLGKSGTPRRVLMGGGYGWLAVASFKLLVIDLATVDTPRRALAFLAVGGILLAAALVGHWTRGEAGRA